MRWLVVFVFLLSAIFGSQSKLSAQISAEQTLALGRDMLQARDYVLAISYLSKATKAKPYLSEPLWLRASAKLKLADYRGAERDCTRALQLNPYLQQAYRLRALARMHLGKDSLALADCCEGLKQAGPSQQLSALADIAYRRLKGEKVQIPDRPDLSAIPLQPEQPRIFGLTFTHPYNGLIALSYPHTSLSNINNRGELPSHLYLSQESGVLPDSEQAVALFSYAEDMEALHSPLTVAQALGVAVARAMLRDYDSALSSLNDSALSTSDLPVILLEKAAIYSYMQMPEQTLQALDKVLVLEPDNIYALFNKAIILNSEGEPEQALALLDKVLELNPNFVSGLYARGLIKLSLNDIEGGAEDLSLAGEGGMAAAYSAIRGIK